MTRDVRADAEAIVQTLDTPDGAFTLIEDSGGSVLGSGWTVDHEAVVPRIHPSLRPGRLVAGTTRAADAVNAYYAGEFAPVMEVPVKQGGTDLQLLGWAALRRITPGDPLTYTEFADELGRPNAVRAAAGICARNAPALFVPCHRVLRAGGSLGGFAWGVATKRSLLDREAGLRLI